MAVPVGVVRELNYVKVTIKELVIRCLLVFSVLVYQPDTVQPTLPAVVAHAEDTAPVSFPEFVLPMSACHAHHRERRNRYPSPFSVDLRFKLGGHCASFRTSSYAGTKTGISTGPNAGTESPGKGPAGSGKK